MKTLRPLIVPATVAVSMILKFYHQDIMFGFCLGIVFGQTIRQVIDTKQDQ